MTLNRKVINELKKSKFNFCLEFPGKGGYVNMFINFNKYFTHLYGIERFNRIMNGYSS